MRLNAETKKMHLKNANWNICQMLVVWNMNPLETCFMNSMEKRGTVEWSLLILSRFSFSEPKLQKSMQAVKCCSYIYRLLSGAECNNRLVHLELFHKTCITTNTCFAWNIFYEKFQMNQPDGKVKVLFQKQILKVSGKIAGKFDWF